MPVTDTSSVEIVSGRAHLGAVLKMPEDGTGLVLFAHGSGSGRFSPRNQFVAGALNRDSIATLLVDLLDETESDDRRKVFDIDFLTDRLLTVTAWAEQDQRTAVLPIAYFGASTGAAAALQAAALHQSVKSVVSRGGRPDLAASYLPKVKAPTLLIVGGSDYGVIELNQQAYDMMTAKKEMVIVPDATHLFEEPGALEKVADLASKWFHRHFSWS